MNMQKLLQDIWHLYQFMRGKKKSKYDRHVSFGDLFTDRWERAQFLGFGIGSSCYDNVLVIGDVKVGEHTWIGPNTILDGSGGLEIGSYCSISAGVQIYSHDSVRRTIHPNWHENDYSKTKIGDHVFIGPQAVIQRGVTIGNNVTIGAMSFVNRDVASGATCYGIPAKIAKTLGENAGFDPATTIEPDIQGLL